MRTIRDSDGAETLHAIYPSWAMNIAHLTVTEYVPKAQVEALTKEIEGLQKELRDARKLAVRHMQTMRANTARMRDTESALNKYYAIIQQHGLYRDDLDDSPLISVKV